MSSYSNLYKYVECCDGSQQVSMGSTGTTGPTGSTGETGHTGAQGPTGPGASQILQQVLAVGNSAGNQSATDFDNIGAVSVETGKVYQGNFTALQIGESGDNLQIKGATALGSMLVGNGVNTEELLVGADGLVLTTNSSAPLGVEWATLPTGQTGATGPTGPSYTGTYFTNSQTISIIGSVGADIIATGCPITLSAGTYMVQAQITVTNTVTQDSALCYIRNITSASDVANSRGVCDTSFTTQYTALVSNLTIVVLTGSTTLCPAATRNGVSALTCPIVNVCGGPNLVITAIRIA